MSIKIVKGLKYPSLKFSYHNLYSKLLTYYFEPNTPVNVQFETPADPSHQLYYDVLHLIDVIFTLYAIFWTALFHFFAFARCTGKNKNIKNPKTMEKCIIIKL